MGATRVYLIYTDKHGTRAAIMTMSDIVMTELARAKDTYSSVVEHLLYE